MYFGMSNIGGLAESVIPGYGVTMAPVNFCAWRATGTGTIRSFGLENQYVQYPLGYPPEAYFMANNPQLMQRNPMMLGIFDFTHGGCYC